MQGTRRCRPIHGLRQGSVIRLSFLNDDGPTYHMQGGYKVMSGGYWRGDSGPLKVGGHVSI
jgi:hypothetical protein